MPQTPQITDASTWFRDQVSASYRDLTAAPYNVQYATDNDGVGPSVFFDCATTTAELRYRLAYTLSNILVVSIKNPDIGEQGAPEREMYWYWQFLKDNAFNSYGNVVQGITFSQHQLYYLTFIDSRKSGAGGEPDENYARELLQLFTLGLYEIDADGEFTTNENYTRDDVAALARVFTGVGSRVAEAAGPQTARGGSYTDFLSGQYQTYIAQLNAGSTTGFTETLGKDFQFNVFHENHDFGEITFLGQTIPSAQATYDAIVDPDGADYETVRDLIMGRIEAAVNIVLNKTYADGTNVTLRNLAKQLIGHHVSREFTPEYFRRVVAAGASGTAMLPDGTTVGDGTLMNLEAMIAAVIFDTEALNITGAVRSSTYGRYRGDFLSAVRAVRPLIASASMDPTAYESHAIGNSDNWQTIKTVPFTSPSVFNFFEYLYTPPSTTFSANGQHAPELGAVDAIEAKSYIRQILWFAFNMAETDWSGGFSGASTQTLDVSRFTSVAHDNTALVAALNDEFCSNRLQADTIAKIEALVDNWAFVDTAAVRFKRFRLAWAAVVCSEEFLIQR